MCYIWQRKRERELSADELDRILLDPLFREIRHVGINGGEPTLRGDLNRLVGVLIRRLPHLAGFSLITNALRSEKVNAVIDTIGALTRPAGVALDVMVSLDGLGEVHDRVRGVAGNFREAVAVLDHSLSARGVTATRIGCTIIAENAFDVENVLAFARQRNIRARFRIGVPHRRLYTAGLREPFMLDDDARFHVAAFLDGLAQDYERDPGRQAFYRSLRDQLAYGHPRAAGCAWKNHGITLNSRGELSFCAIASPVLGDARVHQPDKLFWQGAPVLQSIRTDACPNCRHDYDGIADRTLLLKKWARRIEARSPALTVRAARVVRRSMRLCGEWSQVLHGFGQHGATGARPRAILLCGWYGTETLGDRAILAGICRLVREERPDILIDVASFEPFVTEQTRRWLPELSLRGVRRFDEAIRAVQAGEYAAVAIAGGPLMTPVPEILALFRLLTTARKKGIPFGVLGCGIGPIGCEGARRRAIASLLRAADICVLRDQPAAEQAAKWGRRKERTVVACDPAFLWEALRVGRGNDVGGPPSVALALREWPLHEYAAGISMREARRWNDRLESELVVMVRRLLAAPVGVRVVPICMHTLAVGGDDRSYYRRVFAEIPEVVEAIAWRRRAPHDDLRQLRSAGAICGMRFHSVVFALALRKPFLAIDYTRGGKIAALMDATGNRGRLIGLDEFDGRATADRILGDLAEKNQPAAIDTTDSETKYRGAIRELLP